MKRIILDIEKAQNSLNWQETGKFEEIRTATGRRMKSSPILGHSPNSFWSTSGDFKVAQLDR